MLDKFHLSIEQLSRLTDRQIHELYLHPRTKDGAIDFSEPTVINSVSEGEPEATFSSELNLLNLLAANHLLSEPERMELERNLAAKYNYSVA